MKKAEFADESFAKMSNWWVGNTEAEKMVANIGIVEGMTPEQVQAVVDAAYKCKFFVSCKRSWTLNLSAREVASDPVKVVKLISEGVRDDVAKRLQHSFYASVVTAGATNTSQNGFGAYENDGFTRMIAFCIEPSCKDTEKFIARLFGAIVSFRE